MRIFVVLALVFLVQGAFGAQRSGKYDFSDTDRSRFEKRMEAELKKSAGKVPELLKSYQKKGDVDLTIRVRVDHAAAMQEVKATLVGNLMGSDILRSSKVRDELLDILGDDSISEEDLIELQNVINEERAKIQEMVEEEANEAAEAAAKEAQQIP